jgi:hypothetical protein
MHACSPVAAMAAQASSTSIVECIRAFSKPSICVDKGDLAEIHRCCEVLRSALKTRCIQHIAVHHTEPMLFVYGSDCTPISTSERFEVACNDVKIVRGGRASQEFLIQRLLVFTRGRAPFVVLEVPIPLSDKTAWTHFGCKRELMKSPREVGCKGLVVEFHKYDRAIKGAVGRLHEQYKLAYEAQQDNDLDQGTAYRLYLTHWFFCEGCFGHDCHGSLRWSVLSYSKDKDVMRSAYLIHESLRQGYNLLVQHVGPWLRQVLGFRDWANEELRGFYASLGVEEAPLVNRNLDAHGCAGGSA